MIRACSILACFFLLAGTALSQDKSPHILLMTGKVLKAEVTGNDTMFMYYNETRKSGKVRSGKLDMERVYSFTNSAGEERIIYSMDTTVGNYFSQEEMRYYIYGEQDAMQSYKANWVLYAAAPVAGGGGYLLSSSFLVFAVPFLYVVGAAAPKVKIKTEGLQHPNLLKEPAYVLGYERTARTRRLFKALVAGVTGTAVGFALGQTLAQ